MLYIGKFWEASENRQVPYQSVRGPFHHELGVTTLRQEPQNVEIMVNACTTLHNMLRTAGADDAGCWSWHTQQSASVGIYSHVLVSKRNRR